VTLPRSKAPVEAVAIGSVALLAALTLALEPGAATGAVAALAAVANAARLALWRPLATRREPILWVLHLGYAWLVASLALLTAADLLGAVPHSAGLHALAVGAVGTMLLAVMSRASLGHTGRPLVAPPAAVAAYGLVSAAAVLRIAATLPSGLELPLLVASGLAFAAAYALFIAVFAPVLLLPRVDGKSR
jgi:uncharacterized protein involved in response to NO